MKKYLLLIIPLLVLPVFVFSQNIKKKAIYFYSDTCSHCYKVDQYFNANNIYSDFEIRKLDATNTENLKLLNEFFDVYNVEEKKRGWPVIFLENKMLFGDQQIISDFYNTMEITDAFDYPTPESVKMAKVRNNEDAETQVEKNKISIPIPILIGAAFVDASNPCALAVLILLLATVMAAKGKHSALLAGLLFSLAIFLSYFFMGVGVYKAITVFSLPKYLSLGIGIFSIIIGLANLKDVFWYGRGFIMEVPLSWRPKMQALIRKVTNPIGAFGIGFLVSLFLVPCASGPYVAILGLLAQKVETGRTMLLLVLYNLVFVLPMIIITFAMYFFNARMGKLEAWRQKNLRVLHAIAAGVMFFIGGYLIYGWL